jgi:hypothetical protein
MSEFGRQVAVEFGIEGSSGKRLSGLRISFQVEMSRSDKPNTASIIIYNANSDTVALLQREDAIVRLLAGYETPLQLFQGNPTQGGVYLEKVGPDRVLKIEAQDGQRQTVGARISKSYATQTTSGQIFDDLMTAMALPLGTIDLDRTVKHPQGLVLSGYVRDLLTTLVESQGRQWFVRDGVVQVVPRGGSTGETAVVFSSVSKNLIGAPVRTKDGVKVVALLSPSLRPGKPFRVISEEVNGDYIADDVTFVGDSGWSNDFYVVATGRPL